MFRTLAVMFHCRVFAVQIWLGVRLFHVLCCTFCEVLMYLAVKEKFGRWELNLWRNKYIPD